MNSMSLHPCPKGGLTGCQISIKTGEPDRHDCDIKVVDGVEVAPGPVWHSLYRWIVSQAADFLAFQTVYLITDNRDLLAETVSSTVGLSLPNSAHGAPH